MQSSANYKQFTKGQKVRNCFGEELTVCSQTGCQVFVYEDCLGWYHPNKLFAVAEAH